MLAIVSRTGVAVAATAAVLSSMCATNSRAATDGVAASVEIQPAAVEAHMRFLASDLMEGREAGTRGYDLAANYVATQFQLLGLRPAAKDGSYFQSVPLQAHWLVKDRARLIVRPAGGGRAVPLSLGQQFIVSSSASRATSGITAPAVFVGYGIEAPAFTHNDYDGLNVSGKVVVALSGFPSSFPSEEGAHYGSALQKRIAAEQHGAVGLVLLYTERFEKVFPWTRAIESLDQMSMAWVGPDGMPSVAAPGIQVSAMMSPKDGAILFDGAPRSYADVRAEAAKGAPKGFPLAVSIELAQASRHERRSSANVAAILQGSDPVLRDEYVVITGHLDHEGIGQPIGGDAIYNGAMDNAAGIAGMLEAARALTSEPTPPRRSIMFLAVTAEEKGLLGSAYFARNPTVPLRSIVANVNLDMPVLLYDFTDVIAFGAQHSSLKGVLESALAQMGLTLTPDPMPEQAIFTRSDHYRFVEQGVPSIMLSTGWNTAKGAGEGGKFLTGFLETQYHRPSDDLKLPINYEAGARFAKANYLILKAIADADARPTWNTGDFFGKLFASGR